MPSALSMRRRRGFTLVEALAAAALLGVGVTASMSALGAISRAETGARERANLQRLAASKFDEVISTNSQTLASESGDFSDYNIVGYTWNMDVEGSQVSNLDTVRITVQKQNALPSDPVGRVEGMIYVSPNSTNQSAAPAGGLP